MPMIQGIDGGALIQAFRAGRNDRFAIEDRERQHRAQDEELEHKRQVRGLVGQLYEPGEQPSVASQFGAPEASGPASFGEAFSPETMGALGRGEDPAPVAPPAPQRAPSAPARQVNRDALTQLILLEPEVGARIASALKDMDDANLERIERRNNFMGAAAQYVAQGATPEERMERFQIAKPQLLESGYTEEELDGIDDDLSDERLQFFMATAIDYDKIIDNERAEREDAMQQQDRDADNARQDRNTESLVEQRGRNTDSLVRQRERNAETAEQREARLAAAPPRGGGGGRGTRGGSSRTTPVRVSSPAEAQNLEPGTLYRTPDGTIRRR